jgi:PhzF family phenazine biosynthesis protein
MKIKIYQIDAFTDKVFGGNPAAVCILDKWLEDEIMQNIGAENNLAETAFVVKRGNDFEIRWFTPTVEVDLCGHATLAAAYVLYEYCDYKSDEIIFHSNASGKLLVRKEDDSLILNFPSDTYNEVETPQTLIDAFGKKPIETFKGKTDYLLIYQSQKDIENIKPNIDLIASIGGRGVIVSSQGEHTDFVSRFFAPQAGVDEDPVTGSAHTTLAPIWSKKLNKEILTAKQLSKREGNLICKYLGDRVEIKGKAVTYLIGEIYI